MKIDRMEPETAWKEGLRLPFAFVRRLSGVFLGATPAEVPMEEVLEARFFDEHCEIRIFHRNGSLSAACLNEEPGDKTLKKEYRLDNPKFGGRLTECCCLDAASDDDGQVFVSAVRLAGWREA